MKGKNMKGEHKGDFSRDTFDPSKHFLRVLMQQGRVSLDADWNEQMDILLHYMQTLAKDIIGPFAGPAGEEQGFDIIIPDDSTKSFNIGYGRYYVDGILCENEKKISCGVKGDDKNLGIGYYHQPDYPITKNEYPLKEEDLPLLVYLDVWERHISYVEDDHIREKALGGPDTASRSKVVWQVKVRKTDAETCKNINWKDEVLKELQPQNRGCLKARANKPADETDPCITSPEARYRGEENQLYRVEIHRGGEAGKATFKWSRDNGSVIFPILDIIGNDIIMLEHPGRDDRLSLKVGDWVEVIDDVYTLLVQSRPSPFPESAESDFWPRPLAQVDSVDLAEMKATLKLKKDYSLPKFDDIRDYHPLLRRWDYHEPDLTKRGEPELVDDGFYALTVKEGTCKDDDGWLTLEDGVQICFLPSPDKDNPNMYQAGDYWLIPARTATGDVEWPKDDAGNPTPLPPHGIEHHYAPLAVIKLEEIKRGTNWTRYDCRCFIKYPLNPPCNLD